MGLRSEVRAGDSIWRKGKVHKFSKAIAVMGLLTPLGASALGVGDIRLHSALNQSLNAEIPLVLSGGDSLSDIKVGLAPPEAFTKAGVERQYFLTKLQFSAVQKPDGSYVIQVSSRDVMREPFLSFLVEVNWPQGRVLREFTVLLDPPATLPEAGFAETESPVVEPRPQRYERVAEIGPSGEAQPARRRARRVGQAAPHTAMAPAVTAAPPTENQLTGETYGPVRRDENLWAIAKSLPRSPSVSQEQMLMGLFRANPQAFRGNINTLKAGSTLRIPTPDYLTQLSTQQARAEFGRHQGWSAGRLAAGGEGAEVPENQLKLLAPSEAKSKAEGAAAGSEARAAKAKGELALEVAETVKQENEEFRSRLGQLEQKLGELQRLIVLKDEQIASLQTQRGGVQKPSEAPVQPALPVAPAAPAGQAAPSVPPVGAQKPVPEAPPQPAPSAEPATPAAKPPTPAPSAPVAQPLPKPVVRPTAPPPEEPGFTIEPVYVGGAVAIVAAGLVAWLIRRRRNAMIAETESILLAAERESQQKAYLSPTAKGAESAMGPVMAPKSSFLSEFTPSDFDALGTEADEVDPVAEADVYLAYGRYKQAEELIRHAIEQHPERDECKLKLLEIYSATDNRSAFQNYVKNLRQTYKGAQPEFWAKIEDMGREMAPGSSLFQAPAATARKAKAPGADSSKRAGALDLSDDLIDDLKRFEIEFSEPAAVEEDLFVQLDAAGEEPEQREEVKGMPPLSFDLGAPDSAKGKIAAKEVPEEHPESDNLIAFERSPSVRKEKTPPQQAEKTIDDILRELTSNIANEAAEQGGVQAKDTDTGADHPPKKLEFDLELVEPEPAEKPEQEIKLADASHDVVTDLTDMDQFETKLDLARAYSDMEDDESAREILQDVLDNGNDKQKSEARTLLKKIGSAAPELSLSEPRTGRG